MRPRRLLAAVIEVVAKGGALNWVFLSVNVHDAPAWPRKSGFLSTSPSIVQEEKRHQRNFSPIGNSSVSLRLTPRQRVPGSASARGRDRLLSFHPSGGYSLCLCFLPSISFCSVLLCSVLSCLTAVGVSGLVGVLSIYLFVRTDVGFFEI